MTTLSFKSRVARLLDETLTQMENSMEADPTVLLGDKAVATLEKIARVTALASDWSGNNEALKNKSVEDLEKMFQND